MVDCPKLDLIASLIAPAGAPPLGKRLGKMASVAEHLQVLHRVGPAGRLGQDVVDLRCRRDAVDGKAALAETRVPGQRARS